MTDSMKCPFCGQKLECCGTYTDGTKKLWCDNCGLFGDNRLFEELIRTRKALDVAVYALKEYEDRDSYDCDGNWCGCEHSTAHKALTKITALEQKDE